MRRLVLVLASSSFLLFACGDDDGGGADAPPPDAPPTPDVITADGPTGGGGAYQIVQCGDDPGGPDAAPIPDAAPGDAPVDAGPTPDAGPAPDAGPPTGFNEPCCDPTGLCEGGQVCIENRNNEPDTRNCRPRCPMNGGAGTCPDGSRCINFTDGMGVCLAAGAEGEMCSPEFCTEGLVCVGPNADNAFCRRCCTATAECPSGQTCQMLGGSSPPCPMACDVP